MLLSVSDCLSICLFDSLSVAGTV